MQFLGLLWSMLKPFAHVRHMPVTFSQVTQFKPQSRQLFAPSLYYPTAQIFRATQVVPSKIYPVGQTHSPADKTKGLAHVLHAPVNAAQEVQLAEQNAHWVPVQYWPLAHVGVVTHIWVATLKAVPEGHVAQSVLLLFIGPVWQTQVFVVASKSILVEKHEVQTLFGQVAQPGVEHPTPREGSTSMGSIWSSRPFP